MIDTNVLAGGQLQHPPTNQQVLFFASASAFGMQIISGGFARLNQVLVPTPPPIEPQTQTLIATQLNTIRSAAAAINEAAATTLQLIGRAG
jgi:hypothetical protein